MRRPGLPGRGIHVGVKTHAAWKKDVALIVSDEDCACAAVYTKNAVKAAHIHVDKRHLADGKARAAVINSGNANACAPMGAGKRGAGLRGGRQGPGLPPDGVWW